MTSTARASDVPTCDQVLDECDKTVNVLVTEVETWKDYSIKLERDFEAQRKAYLEVQSERNAWWRNPATTWPAVFVTGLLAGLWLTNR